MRDSKECKMHSWDAFDTCTECGATLFTSAAKESK